MKTADIKSMTGFGSAPFEVAGASYTLELRSVNSRHLDVRVKLPFPDGRLESVLIAAAKKSLHRGRLEIGVRTTDREAQVDRSSDTLVSTPGGGDVGDGVHAGLESPVADRFRAAHAELSALAAELAMPGELRAGDVVAYLAAIQHDASRSGPSAAPAGFDQAALAALRGALEGLTTMRKREGRMMAMAIGEQMAEAASRVSEIERLAAEQPRLLGEKLRERIVGALAGLGEAADVVDQARLNGEIAMLVDRADVTEELVRLRAHFAHFAEIMAGSPPHGRKLDFLLQEMFREINTTGAKTPEGRISALVVDVKAVFEKIREVVQNVE